MVQIAILGAGAMGSAIGQRLAENNALVIAYLEGRSESSRQRAIAAGMRPGDMESVLNSDIILSVIPPAEALSVAHDVARAARESRRPVIFVDCNAIAPETMKQVAEAFAGTSVKVLDGSIIGSPPKPGRAGPRIYISGDGEADSAALAAHGLLVRRIDGPIGAASALKMCFAGINKGITGLGTAMLLAAVETEAADGLKQELAETIPDLNRKLITGIPDMFPKAYRWVGEMEEIAAFLGPENPASLIFQGMAGLYKKMAEDREAGGKIAASLTAVL